MVVTGPGSVRLGLVVLLGAFVLATVGCYGPPSYTLEKTIPLPDSLSGPGNDAIGYSRRDNRVLVGLWDGRVLVVDAATGEKLAIVPSNGPGALVYDPTRDEVYLPHTEPGARSDPHRDSVLSTLAGVRLCSPEEICVDPVTEKIYCYLHTWSDSITVLDSRSLRVVASVATEHHFPWGTKAVLCNPKMHRVYWVQADGHSPLTVVDAGTNQTIASVEVGKNATPLCYNPTSNKVYIRSDSRALLVLDCESNQVVASIPVTGLNDQMCCNVRENKVYGIEGLDSTVIVIDGVSDRVITRVRVPGEADEVVYDSTRNRVYCCGQDWVAAVDCRTDSVIGLVRTNTTSSMTREVLCPQVGRLYFQQWSPYEVYAIDCDSFKVVNRITTGYFVEGVVYSRERDKLYCANASSDAVAVLNASDGTVRSTLRSGRYPWAFCTDQDGKRVYCANMGSGDVTVIDGDSDAVVGSIEVPRRPVGLCYSARHNKLYCVSESAIAVIDCRSDTVIKEIALRTYLWPGLLYDSVSDRAFCISEDRVVAIDAGSDSIIAEARVNKSLWGLVHDPIHEKLYCSAWDGAAIYVVECGSMKVRGRVITGAMAWLARMLPYQHLTYVRYGRGIAIVNTDNDCAVGMIELAKTANSPRLPRPDQFVYDSTNQRLFIARGTLIDVFGTER